ncbi:MAG: hypothetical protein DYG91_00185 [Chloroflexi bacterium CFX7]|nr:hypothetical protein [Chloroflexi bacterium CFX7]MCK6563119.1 hypothetical protein [Dehalococcoidia bacterium]RIL02878.1 MAG: hypothetical protein DCC78_05385 [bacterium]
MIHVLYGVDALGLRRRLQQLKDEADGGSGMLATNFAVVDGRDAKPADILGPAMMPPFLAPRRLVLVEGLLDRFEARPGQRQPRSADSLAPLFEAFEAGLPESTLVVFTGGDLKRNSLLDRLKRTRGVQLEHFPEIKGEDLIRYIRTEGAARGLRFRPGGGRPEGLDQGLAYRGSDPAALLAALCRSDTLAIANELDKLALYTMGREVTIEDVARICSGEREANRFQFVDRVMDGEVAKALDALALLRRDGESSQALLGLLADSYRTAATVLDLLEEGATPEAIGTAINRPWPRLRDSLIARARRIGPSGVKAAYAAIVESDRQHKRGEVDEDLAFELLVIRLSALSLNVPARR